ncbi:hypothetical protein J2Z79_002248 [Symbiobacterium terraclitae]|uniref:Uncharacterized protein n=2 Tax=Symbiobacterium TaxID=2733 RepID=A0A953IFB0_SYMTR|nr:hypothetical protein [Symbiobacterium terraclitae]MBY6278289.1 hypothetical protein [Symbiobacterium thermophilum]
MSPRPLCEGLARGLTAQSGPCGSRLPQGPERIGTLHPPSLDPAGAGGELGDVRPPASAIRQDGQRQAIEQKARVFCGTVYTASHAIRGAIHDEVPVDI